MQKEANPESLSRNIDLNEGGTELNMDDFEGHIADHNRPTAPDVESQPNQGGQNLIAQPMDENKYTDQIRKQDLQKFSKAVGITLGDQDTSVKSGNFRIAPPSRKTVDAIFLVQPEGTAVFLNHI